MGKKNIIFIDDLNMPKKELFGAQPPLELLRQQLDDHGWYDRKTLEFKTIVDLQFVASMGLGRPEIPRRLIRHFNVQNIFEYDVDTIKHVFSCIINHSFLSYPDNIKSLHKPLTNIVVEIYR